jgi:hypothetical protein
MSDLRHTRHQRELRKAIDERRRLAERVSILLEELKQIREDYQSVSKTLLRLRFRDGVSYSAIQSTHRKGGRNRTAG